MDLPAISTHKICFSRGSNSNSKAQLAEQGAGRRPLGHRTQMPASTLGRGISAKRRTQQDFQHQERKENPGARAAFRNTFVYM